MTALLIPTKLHIPQVRAVHVARPRLETLLQQGLDRRLILISAPAGYGKTTLIGSWVNAFPHTAWVSLNKDDNEPARFWAYTFGALQGVFISSGKPWPEALTGFTSPDETMLAELITLLDEWSQPMFLVLDDYHSIHTQTIHEQVQFLLDHAPPYFHLIITTRADPPLTLAKFRARAEMVEIRQADLCFTVQEASGFLSHTMGLQVSEKDVIRLTERTEGWIAGLQMAALSMQNTEDISGFITTLTGAHHYIFDYLLEEILERQTPEIRQFLLYSSILDQFTAPLCDALLIDGPPDPPRRPSRVMLEELERNNLFIQPMDHDRHWYRYHALFAELLRGYLQRTHADRIPALHILASVWFEKQDLIPDAIHHALAAGEWERVVRLISTNVLALLEQNELNTVIRQLDRLIQEENRAQPWLLVGRIWLTAYTGQVKSVDSLLEKAEISIGKLESEAEQQILLGQMSAIRAYAAWILGNRELAAQSAQTALDCLPPTHYLMRCQAATTLGLSQSDLKIASQTFEQALRYAREISVSDVPIFAYACWAFSLAMQGRLREAYEVCQETIELAQLSGSRQPLPSLSHTYSTMSVILFEWNDLEGALRYAREAVHLAQRWEQADALHYAYTNLGNALLALGDVEGAFDILRRACQVAHRTSPWFEAISLAQEVDWYLWQGNLESALQCLRDAQVDIEDPSHFPRISAQIFIAQKRYAKALPLITSYLEDQDKKSCGYLFLRGLTWQSLAYAGNGQMPQALASLTQALRRAAPEGYVRLFIGAGDPLIQLLHQARMAEITPDYVDRLLAHIEQTGKPQREETRAVFQMVEPLSGREMEVLILLSEGNSDKKIAAALVIARETVHKHLKNIYEKLGVHSRTEAVARARELGLL